ncbi:MAG: CocE/NonD family hydrolase [Actinomycetota bacterium]|nr:CocE/NonD family hydrolase [Actinomycetota bacterium]
MPSCDINGRAGSRKIEGYIPVAEGTPDETTLHYQVLLPPCRDTDGDGTLDFKGPYPMVLDYSGYQPAIEFYDSVPERFLPEGYAVAGVNIRGTGCSGGRFDYFEPRQSKDGAEAIEFLTSQPYSNGRLAMVGKSYPGITQLFVAPQRPEGLVAIVPGHVFGDLYRDVPYPGGIQNTTFAGGWSAGRIYDQVFHGPGKAIGYDFELQFPERKGDPDPQCARNQLDHAPNPALNPFVKALYNHYDNELFMQRSPWYFADKINVPTFLIESWQDEQVGSRATELIERFAPDLEWRFLGTNGDHGEYYGSDVLPEIYRFLRYHLAQEVPAEDVERYGSDYATALAAYNAESPVQINWETGAKGGRAPAWTKRYSSWPPPMVEQADPWRLYLTPDGGLTANEAAKGSVTYDYRPVTGTQQRGGYKLQGRLPDQTVASWNETPAPGTYAMFQTAVLTSDALLAGPASLDMWVSSTAIDTDFQVTMTEVRPCARDAAARAWCETFVQQGWLRASHRRLVEDTRVRSPQPIGSEDDTITYDPTGIDDPRGPQKWSTPLRPFHSHLMKDSDPLVPGTPTPVRIEIFPLAHAFRAGSALRIYVEAPHVKPDLWGFALLPTPARNTIYTGGEHDSSLALPLLEGEVAEASLPPCQTGHVHSPLRNQPCRVAIEPAPRAAGSEPEPTTSASATPSAEPTQGSSPSASPSAEPSIDPSTTPTGEATQSASPTPSEGSGGGGSGGGGSGGSPSASASPTAEPSHSQAGSDEAQMHTTIAADDPIVRFREPFTLSGMVTAPRTCTGPFQVDVMRRRALQDSFTTIATVDVEPDLTWSLGRRGRHNASYIAAVRSVPGCEGQHSAPTDVLVRALLNVDAPDDCRGRIKGRVLPRRDEGRVQLQRRNRDGWTTIDNARIRRDSRFTLRADRCGTHRVRWKSDGLNLGANRPVKLSR